MIDAEMLTGALIAAGAFLAGVPVGAVATARRLRAREPEQPEPICGCDHSKGEHDKGSDGCRAEIRRKRWNRYGDETGYDWVPCPCTRYFGPEPLPDLYATPRYLPPSGGTP